MVLGLLWVCPGGLPVFRTGAYALRLDAPLYGLPVMLVAISCMHTARRKPVTYEADTQHFLALMRFGGA